VLLGRRERPVPGGRHLLTFDCVIQVVTTPKGTINEYLKGSINGGSAPPSRAIHDVTTADTGLFCDLISGATDIVKGTVTPSGQVNLTCRGPAS
jgi:hypothetical protein